MRKLDGVDKVMAVMTFAFWITIVVITIIKY